MPDTVEDDGEGSDGTPSDDLESADPIESKKDTVKFGWIKGVLVSCVRSWVCFIEAGVAVHNCGAKQGFQDQSRSDLHLLKGCWHSNQERCQKAV